MKTIILNLPINNIEYSRGDFCMKRIFLIMIISIFLFSLMGCGDSPATKAQKFSKVFLEKLYTFKDTDKIIDEQSLDSVMMGFLEGFKPYMTEKTYNNLIASRELSLTYIAAWTNNCNISVSNIKTSLKKEYKEDKFYVMDYSLDIIATPLSGDKETKYPITGEITIKEDNKKFLVQDYRGFSDKEWQKFARKR